MYAAGLNYKRAFRKASWTRPLGHRSCTQTWKKKTASDLLCLFLMNHIPGLFLAPVLTVHLKEQLSGLGRPYTQSSLTARNRFSSIEIHLSHCFPRRVTGQHASLRPTAFRRPCRYSAMSWSFFYTFRKTNTMSHWADYSVGFVHLAWQKRSKEEKSTSSLSEAN